MDIVNVPLVPRTAAAMGDDREIVWFGTAQSLVWISCRSIMMFPPQNWIPRVASSLNRRVELPVLVFYFFLGMHDFMLCSIEGDYRDVPLQLSFDMHGSLPEFV